MLSPVFEFSSDSNWSTISASEFGHTQKKIRVLVKKLPQHILDKHFRKMNSSPSLSPSRISKRVKILPAKYRYMEMNKTLQEPSKERTAIKMKSSSKNAVPIAVKKKYLTHENKWMGISKNSKTISKPKTAKNVCLTEPQKTLNKPQVEAKEINTVIMDSSKLLVITQPALRNDPLNVPPLSMVEKAKNNDLEKNPNKDFEPEVATETDKENDMDVGSEGEGVVVKQIFFTSKSVQTKFTCNGSICGLVDTDEFNLNCFYCYKIFPLHMWLEFKEHIKIKHNVKEKQNQTQELANDAVILESPTNKSVLKDQETNRIKVKSLEQLYSKTPIPRTNDYNNKEKSPLIKPVISHKLNQSENKFNLPQATKKSPQKKPAFCNQLNQTENCIDLTNIAEKSPSKNPAPNNHLKQSQEKSPAKKSVTNNLLLQSDEFIDLFDSEENMDLQTTPEQSIAKSSDNINPNSSTIEDFNDRFHDEIISIGDDEGEDEELNEIIENFSNEIQTKNTKVKNILNSSPTKLSTLNNSNKNKSQEKNYAAFQTKEIWSPELQTFKKIYVVTPDPNKKNTQIPFPKLPQITIRKLDKATANETFKACASSSETPQATSTLKKAYIKLPSNLNIEEVLKTIPKPQQNSTSIGSTKPRYFVVKKVVKPITAESEPNISLPSDTIITKMPAPIENQDGDDDMPSNDENEDEVPKPTNGYGILFGLTNRDVVIQFLFKLKTYPELWRPHLKNDTAINYDQSIQELCQHLNDRFDLNIQDFEMRLSIQRVKDWYCRMLKDIYVHNQNRNNIEPYKHSFPEYFKILNKFLTSDVHNTRNLLLSKRFKSSNTSMNDYPKWMIYKPGKGANTELEEQQKKQQQQQKKPIIKFKPTILPEDDASQNVIEFDADTFYQEESSDDEILILPPSPKPKSKPKTAPVYNIQNMPQPKRTKVYCPVVPIVCDICGRNFKRNIDLRRHRVGHFPPQFQCALCSQMFLHKHWAEKCSHGKKRKIKSFNDDDNTNRTLVTPTKIKSLNSMLPNFRNWMCEICGISYRSVGSLTAHKRDKHLNQRLKCVVCKFTAVTNYRIVQHQKKRHVVEPGTVEEVAKKCRARMDSKTPFTPEVRREFDWRREQRKKLKPGEMFYGCCKCRIIFNNRKEKMLHNKVEHPIKDTTVICLLCHPEKLLLSNSNSVRRHYTDIHKVPWDEIDDLVKRTKPIFQLLSKDEIELLNSSQNYSELLVELMVKRNQKLDPEPIKEETTKAVEILSNQMNAQYSKVEEENLQIDVTVESSQDQEEKVYVDGIIDHDYNEYEDAVDNNCHEEITNESMENKNEHVYNEGDDNYDDTNNDNNCNDKNQDNDNHSVYSADDSQIKYQIQNNSHVDEEIQYEGELVEESIVVEEFDEDDIIEEVEIEEYF